MWQALSRLMVAALVMVVAACGGGGSGFSGSDSDGGTTTGGGGTSSSASSVVLVLSSPFLPSDDSQKITASAIVRDANNNLMSGETVVFSANSGALLVMQPTTGDSGAAIAELGTGGDFSNRDVTVSAAVGDATATAIVTVSGTTIAISGENSTVLNGTQDLSITLKDAAGAGIGGSTIALSSAQGNTLSATTLTTNAVGVVDAVVRGDVSGADTIQASALGASSSFSFNVSPDAFEIEQPNPNVIEEVQLGVSQTVTVRWLKDGVPQGGQTVNFSATRGTITPSSAITDGSGVAIATISSTDAGPAVIAVTTATTSAQVEIEFVATIADEISVQADPESVAFGGQQSTITAVVRDPNNNLVKNKRIRFVLSDVTGGTIGPATGETDSNGSASTVYTSSNTSSGGGSVLVTAIVDDTPAVTGTVSLTVGQRALFITVGTGNEITEPNSTEYIKPYSVSVKDVNSNAVAGKTVQLRLISTRYDKGEYRATDTDGDGNFDRWVAFTSLPAPCSNEDINGDGFRDAGEDTNNNQQLDPGSPASVVGSVVTGSDGSVEVGVKYPQEYGEWVEVRLEATASVAGTESLASKTFWLPVLAADVLDENIAPPGLRSPFGVAGSCLDPT